MEDWYECRYIQTEHVKYRVVVLEAMGLAYFKMITTDSCDEMINMMGKVMVKIIIHMIVNILMKLLFAVVVNIGGKYGG